MGSVSFGVDPLDDARIRLVAGNGERLDVEFKSDRTRLSDADIVEAVVCLVNLPAHYDHGMLLIGVENDGAITGARHRHGLQTDPAKLQAMIFGRAEPAIETSIVVVPCREGEVIAIRVPRGDAIHADKTGKAVRRVMALDGPQCVPFYPHEHRSYRSDLGLIDLSAQALLDLSLADLDPLEMQRVRHTITRLRGDASVIDLDDESLAKALNIVQTHGNRLVPNVAGLLLLGRREVLNRILPNHEVAFQVFGPSGDVLVNDSLTGPLLQTLEDTERRFAARNSEQEEMIGLFRFPIPDVAPDAFREAINNAVLHRDYAINNAVYIHWHPDRLLITNPGGFPRGITLDNLLVHEPVPRNRLLADVFKRLGLVERTGRGIDRIFYNQLRYGRPVPDYTRSDPASVRVTLSSDRAGVEFARFIFEQGGLGRHLELDALLILDQLRRERRTNASLSAKVTQKSDAAARAILERFVEWGIAEARGERRGRVFLLGAAVYRALGERAEYVRTSGFERIQHEAMILRFVDSFGTIRRADAIELCALAPREATRLLDDLTKRGELARHGERRGTYYARTAQG